MKTLVPVLLLAALLPLGGCLCAPAPYAPYAAANGPWANYDPYYEYGAYRNSDQPLAYYGAYDAPHGHTYYGSYRYGY